MASRGQTLAPVALVARANLRRRWRTVVAVGLLFGLAAGIGLACLGGARRTASVFQRHLVASDAAEIEIDPGNVTPEADRALRSLPHVTGAHYWVTYSAFALKRSGVVDQRLLHAVGHGGVVAVGVAHLLDDLLRAPHAKPGAWADLCRAHALQPPAH